MRTALYKTTIVIWTEYATEATGLEDLAREATVGDGYCSRQSCEQVTDPLADPYPPSAEFFRLDEDDEDDEDVDPTRGHAWPEPPSDA